MGRAGRNVWTPSPQEKVKNPARLGAQRGYSKVKRDTLPEGNGGLGSIERCLKTSMNSTLSPKQHRLVPRFAPRYPPLDYPLTRLSYLSYHLMEEPHMGGKGRNINNRPQGGCSCIWSGNWGYWRRTPMKKISKIRIQSEKKFLRLPYRLCIARY